MKQLSIWATRNRRKAQFLLVIINILLYIKALLLGYVLSYLAIEIPKFAFYFLLIISAVALISYLIRYVKRGIIRDTPKTRMNLEFVFLASLFWAITLIVNVYVNKNFMVLSERSEAVHNVDFTSLDEVHDQHVQYHSQSPPKKTGELWRTLMVIFFNNTNFWRTTALIINFSFLLAFSISSYGEIGSLFYLIVIRLLYLLMLLGLYLMTCF